MAYIMDIYSPYVDNSNVKFRFELNGQQWCIRQVEVRDGLPVILLPIEDTTSLQDFYIYKTFAEAYAFYKKLKRINK